jgi:NAD(P)-dependent dehydrogenase (short-subunit alcohol dehydrogenase family)
MTSYGTALAVNLTAPFQLARRLVPEMAERGFGRVLFTSSVAAFTGGVVGPRGLASSKRSASSTYGDIEAGERQRPWRYTARSRRG